MLGDVVHDAPLEQLADSPQPSRPDHDHGGIDLVCNLDDALPGRSREVGSRLSLESRASCTLDVKGAIIRVASHAAAL